MSRVICFALSRALIRKVIGVGRSIHPYFALLSAVKESETYYVIFFQAFRDDSSFSNKLAKIPLAREKGRGNEGSTERQKDRKKEWRCDEHWIMQRAYVVLGLWRVFGLSTLWIGLREFFSFRLFRTPFFDPEVAELMKFFMNFSLLVSLSSWPK